MICHLPCEELAIRSDVHCHVCSGQKAAIVGNIKQYQRLVRPAVRERLNHASVRYTIEYMIIYEWRGLPGILAKLP